jgi:alkylhydroperoxidase family enzyme
MEGYFGWRPDLLEGFKSFFGTLWDEALLSPDLLEMLRLRIAQIHGCNAELAQAYAGSGFGEAKREALADWQQSDLFDESDRVLLSYADQIAFAHHAITDADAAAAKRALGEPAYVAYTIAITLFDALCRVRIVMDLPTANGAAPQPSASIPLR